MDQKNNSALKLNLNLHRFSCDVKMFQIFQSGPIRNFYEFEQMSEMYLDVSRFHTNKVVRTGTNTNSTPLGAFNGSLRMETNK